MKKVVTIVLVSALGFGMIPGLTTQGRQTTKAEQIKLSFAGSINFSTGNLSFIERGGEEREDNIRTVLEGESRSKNGLITYGSVFEPNSQTKKPLLTYRSRAPPINFT